MSTILVPLALGTLVLLILVCVGSVILSEIKAPAASRPNPSDGGGSQAGFDILPCVTSTLALASPRVGLPPPSGLDSPKLVRPGRGMNHLSAVLNAFHGNDFTSAESVAITIDGDKVWLEVDGVNVFRA